MPVFNQKEAEAVSYLASIIDDDDVVYSDRWGLLILRDQIWRQVSRNSDLRRVPDDAYIFFRTWIIDKQEILVMVRNGARVEFKHISLSEISAKLEGRQVIYDNGSARIWSPK